MKKVLSFVLVLSMILGSFGMAFAAAPSDVVGKDYEDAVNVLMELGVVDGYKDGTYRPENVVTRAEMATLIIKALGLNDYAVGKSSFSDMAGHWADAYVAYAASLGFISGYGDGTFRPNQPVTYDQAITMVVQALGYKAEYMVGGYPGAFVAQAKTLGMLDGIKSGAAGANRGDVATLLYNTLPVSFVRYDKNGSLEEIALKGDKKDTMMSRLGAEEYNGGEAFVVTNEIADDAAVNIKSYLGSYVTAYANKDGDVIAIEEVKSVFLTGDWNAKDSEFEADGVTYDVKSLKYNYTEADGKTTGTAAAEEFVNGKKGDIDLDKNQDDVVLAVKVSGKTIKEVYSAAMWEDGVTVKWDEDLADKLADDDELNGEEFAMNDDKEIDTNEFVLLGVTSLDELKEDDIVTYYVSKDTAKVITKVEVSRDIVEGKITKTNKDGDVYIGGKYYEVAETLLSDSDTVKLSDEGKFFLNYAGKIVYSEAESASADDYAIVLESAKGDPSLNGKDAKVKLFLADGTAKTFVIDEDAFWDGDGEKDGEIINNDLTMDSDKVETELKAGRVVKYSVNKDGNIDCIEKTDFDSASKKTSDITSKGTFDGKKLASDVVIFTADDISKKSGDADDYGVTTRSKVLGQEDVVAVYILDEGEIVAIVMEMDGTTGDHVFAVVTDVASLEDDLYEVTFLINGEEKVYTSEDITAKNKNFTTIYAIDFDANGYAVNVTKDLKADDFQEIKVAAIKTGDDITKLSGNKVYVGKDKDFAVTLDSEVIVYKWSTDDAVFEKAGVSDLKGYDNGVQFFDTDDDGVADIVLLVAPAK